MTSNINHTALSECYSVKTKLAALKSVSVNVYTMEH